MHAVCRPSCLCCKNDAVLGSAVLCIAAVVNNLRRLMAGMHDNRHEMRSALEFLQLSTSNY